MTTGNAVMTMTDEQSPLLLFGAELRRRRLAAGLSLSELSKSIHYSKGHLSKVENGVKPAGSDLARRCDAILGASGELAALLSAPKRGAGTTSHDDPGAEWFMAFTTDGRFQFGTLPRRDLLVMAGGMLMSMSSPVPAPDCDDGEVLPQFRAIFDTLRQLGQRLAPAELVPSLVALTRTLQARPSQPEMLILASRFAEFAGWMVQEMGDDQAAIRWTDYATQLATNGGDHQLNAYQYVRRADVALYRHDAIETVALAQRAQSERGSPRVHALAAQREAQGHAIAGDYDACCRALELATRHLDKSDPASSDAPILGTSTIADPVAVARGWCLHDLGRSAEATAILTTELERIPQQAQRARARYGVRLAFALASVHEIERSCAVLQPLLAILRQIDSATIRTDLRQVARILSRRRSDASVRMLMPHISAALHTPVGP
jgi:transcriptional regulator with XRE-family HTH domain